MEKRDTSFITEFNGSGATGQPKYYANWDDNTIVVAPTPDINYAVQLNYIIDPLILHQQIQRIFQPIKNLCFFMGCLLKLFLS